MIIIHTILYVLTCLFACIPFLILCHKTFLEEYTNIEWLTEKLENITMFISIVMLMLLIILSGVLSINNLI